MKTELYQLNPQGAWQTAPDADLDGPNTLVLVFGSTTVLDDTSVIDGLSETFPQSVMVGCSAAGEILQGTVSDSGLTASVTRFDDTELVEVSVELSTGEDSFSAGAAAADSLPKAGLRAVLVFAPGLDVNGSELIRGLASELADGVVVTGGLAGDGPRFERTWVLQNRKPEQRCLTVLGFYGDHIRVGHGSRGGWEIFGPERRVSRSEANVLLELDGKPALALYKHYLGEMATGLPGAGLRFPLALRESTDASRQLVRTVLAVDEADQSMTFAGDIPQGWLAQLMRASSNQLIEGAENAALMTANRGDADTPVLAVAISCVGRRMVLGEGVEEELDATLAIFPEGTKQVGFYSYGELSPYASGICELHNQTMTLTTFHEV